MNLRHKNTYGKSDKKIYHVLLSISLTLFIILIAVKLTLVFKPLYYYDINSLEIENKSGYSKEEIVKNYDYMVEYLLSYNNENKEFELPTIKFSQHGKEHFEDVKRIFVTIDILLLISLIINIIGINIYYKEKKFQYIKYTARTLIILPSILVSIFIIDFDTSFIIFHKLFFNNDYWIFNKVTDPVIKILPQEFFMHAAFMVLIIIILFSVAFKIIYKKIEKRNYFTTIGL
ncbi:TIGR01906 family membrane protein [Clostridium ihumii]|uniref:TIGR01906 family membrane protein n=1 Tax=Clostridium ihumii TaxID=1470356 RepID=UPI000942608E|nr:TIGR01906 family membrane protein [Clostridium ihumii]